MTASEKRVRPGTECRASSTVCAGAVIALGDSSYGDTYCGGGQLLTELFAELGLREVQPMLRLDASETVNPEGDSEPWVEDFIKALTQ